MPDIPKAYEPQSVESKWYQHWLDQKCFVADPASPKPAYSIVIPPPNVTGVLTLGHVLNNTIQDILARKARMEGHEVLWLPGTDHAGIATQTVVERTLRKEGKIKHRDDLGREKFLEKVWEWKEKHGGIIIQQLKKLGASCDWTRERFTMDPEYSRCVARVFVHLYRKGLIYHGKRMVSWDPVARTALSDEEVIMTEEKGHLWHLKYPLLDARGQPQKDRFLVVATTRPETMLGDEAVAVNPKDERYQHFVGQQAFLPLQNKMIPIIADELVDPKFGTGCVKVTPAHDPADYEMAVRHHLPFTVVIGPDGRMTAAAGEDFEGLDRFAAREAVVEELKEQGLLLKVEEYVHNVGYSERSHVPIEPYLSEQWFLKYPRVEEAIACVAAPDAAGPPEVEGGATATARAGAGAPAMRFHPERWTKTYTHWMANLRDWCISRQLWWGHRVPVWYSVGHQKRDREIVVVELKQSPITGRNIKELRRAAWQWAWDNGLLGHYFPNLDTGHPIYLQKSSLEHAFSNYGVVNVLLVPALPQLIRSAVHVATFPHTPYSADIRAVHVFLAALRLGRQLYRVKFTVKELPGGRRLYDHQSLELEKEVESDGDKSPEAHPREGKLAPRPASDSSIRVAQLHPEVNSDDLFIRCQIECPGPGWEQDPDVLDTWFSSWLWPFATMGWTGDPEKDAQNPTLKKFYPTTALVTGPDIIFFWVARMIMAGYEFMGELPFRHVYFTGIIRDKLGRKMSKSLGNSPDPLDLIAKFGADALRFGIIRSAPLGQDLLFDEQHIELGRNFCNKLWNACRFRQLVGQDSSLSGSAGASPERSEIQGEVDPALLTSDDKWILLKLDDAIRELTDALAEYKFSEAAATLYRFFWSEFCDWYLEAAKAPLSAGTRRCNAAADSRPHPTGAAEEAQRANTLAVLDFVLSHTLRLFHPFLPFITEELWHGMGYSADMPADQGGGTIMFAPWPKPLGQDFHDHYGLDDSCLDFAQQKQELVIQGRNLRREKNIPANKRVKFILKPVAPLAPLDQAVLQLLLNAEVFDVDPYFQAPKGMPSVPVKLGELFLPLEGLFDAVAERVRLTKELEKADAESAKVEQKLNNPAFVQKVPPAVLQEHQKRRADWLAKREQIQKALAALGS